MFYLRSLKFFLYQLWSRSNINASGRISKSGLIIYTCVSAIPRLTNFFMEFDVYFYRSKMEFQVNPKTG